MKRILVIAFLAVAALVTDPVSRIFISDGQAVAQQRDGGRPNLLDLLFGGALRQQRIFRRPEEPPANTRRIIVDRARQPRSTAPQPAARTVVDKAEDAAKVLVVGDFLADGLGWGLQQAYSANPNVVFVDRTNGLSGLVRDDVIDWPGRIGEFIEETKPVAAIVAVGMNDRQLMRTSEGRLDKLSEAWRKEYVARIDRLVSEIRQRNLPLIWMGLPPVRSGNMNADYLVFNEFYRTRVEAAGGSFVDIWDGFTNAEGAFISAGPDINGQIVRLRNSDGINLTRAGKRKLAFYVERELRKATGLGSDAVSAALPGLGEAVMLQSPEYDPAATGKTVIISLDDPRVDGSDVLEGEDDFLQWDEDEGSTSYGLVAEGEAVQPHEGRIDADWGLPVDPPKEKKPAAVTPETAAGAFPDRGE